MRCRILIIILFFGLNALAQHPKLIVPIGHVRYISDAVYSKDGRFFATVSHDSSIKLWDAASGKQLYSILCPEQDWPFVHFSPDGKFFITNGEHFTAKVWDIGTGDLKFALSGNKDRVVTACYSPDGQLIATGSIDGEVKLFNANNGKPYHTFSGHVKTIQNLEFNYDGSLLLSSSKDAPAKIWDVHKKKWLHDLKVANDGGVLSAHLSPVENKAVTFSDDRLVRMWDISTGSRQYSVNDANFFDPHPVFDHTFYTYFTPDGSKLLTSRRDTRAPKIWNVKDGHFLFELKDTTHFGPYLEHVSFSRDSKKVLLAMNYASTIWDLTDGKMIKRFDEHESNDVAVYSPDNSHIITAGGNYDRGFDFKIWDATTFKYVDNQSWHIPKAVEAEYSWNGKNIFVSTVSRTSHDWEPNNFSMIWDAESGILQGQEKNYSPQVPSDQLARLDVDTTNSYYFFGRDSTIEIRSIHDQSVKTTLRGHRSYIITTLFNLTKDRAITSSWDSTAKIWDVSNGKLLFSFKHADKVNWAMFSSDGKRAVTTSDDGTAVLWDALTGDKIHDFKGHEGAVGMARFSNDFHGDYVVTCGVDGTAKVWNSNTGKQVANFADHKEYVTSAYFNPDNSLIVTSSVDNTCKVWDFKKQKLLYTFLALDSANYLVTDPYGRYDGTDKAKNDLYFTCGTEVISLNQFREQLWVPNLVSRIMAGDSIQTPKLDELDICNFVPKVNNTESDEQYRFDITPQRGGIGLTILYVNNNEAGRYQPQELSKTSIGYQLNVPKKSLQTNFISGQQNNVSVKVFTVSNEMPSKSTILDQQKKAPTSRVNLFAVMIGVSDYKNEDLSLQFAAKDAEDMSRSLGTSARKLLNTDGREHVFIYNLTSSPVHYRAPEKEGIKSAFEDISKKAGPDDILLVFFAGHGKTAGINNEFYFLTADASNSTTISALDKVAISTDELTEWTRLDHIKAGKRALIIDACKSGQVINDLLQKGFNGQQLVKKRDVQTSEEIKAIDNLREQTGFLIITASGSEQSAIETGQYGHGYLTYSLLKAIKQQSSLLGDGKLLNVSNWFSAADKNLRELMRDANYTQRPAVSSVGNFDIGIVDQEVRNGVNLGNSRTIFTGSDFRYNVTQTDSLQLRRLADKNMNDVINHDFKNSFVFQPDYEGDDAYNISGDYTLIKNDLQITFRVVQKGKVRWQTSVRGAKLPSEDLIRKMVTKTLTWVTQHKN